jgi:hypothetical protein
LKEDVSTFVSWITCVLCSLNVLDLQQVEEIQKMNKAVADLETIHQKLIQQYEKEIETLKVRLPSEGMDITRECISCQS